MHSVLPNFLLDAARLLVVRMIAQYLFFTLALFASGLPQLIQWCMS